jgi:flagellar basal body-associated protein FliL
METINILLIFLIIALVIFSVVIGGFIWFLRRRAKSVRCVVVHDDGSTKKKDFDRAPDSFTIDKKDYIYDERAVIKLGGLKYLLYKNGVPEPITVFSVKNPRVLSSSEYHALMRSRIHEELFGASEIGLIKVLVIATLVVAVGTALIALIVLFTSGEATLADNEVTRTIIEESVRRAIGR